MTEDSKSSWVLGILVCVFAALAVVFVRVPAVSPNNFRPPIVPPAVLAGIPGGTIRISAGQLIRSGADASSLDCYACHNQKAPPEIKYDANHQVVLAKDHADLIYSMRNCDECHSAAKPVKLEYNPDGSTIIPEAHRGLIAMAHGRNFRNENCYNCHNKNQLNTLHAADGTQLKFEEATLLCAGCHGPTYRDWAAGVHGRTSGYWDRKAGPIKREECTSCHDPHAPAFTGIIPMPGPHLLHPSATAAAEQPETN